MHVYKVYECVHSVCLDYSRDIDSRLYSMKPIAHNDLHSFALLPVKCLERSSVYCS